LSAPAPRASAWAPFSVRAFRYQWPADLATSWALDMEQIILGWYILVETQSVFWLTIYASLQYLGTLIAPMFGVMGDRIGHRLLLAGMRTLYAACATTLMVCAFTGWLNPVIVLCVATVMGLVRPSDIGVRSALVGETMPHGQLVGAMGIQRTTQDSARIIGALTGAGLVAAVGIGPAYAAVTALYVLAIFLTLKAGDKGTRKPAAAVPVDPTTPWRDLREGLSYVWNTPFLLAVMILAFFLNMTAFPLQNSLLPYVAKEVYGASQTVLGYMAAGAATGALISAVVVSRLAHLMRPARMAIFGTIAWYLLLLCFAQASTPEIGIPLLMLSGCAQAAGLVPMTASLLRNSDERFRGRIMGIRMLSIYGNVPGLLLAGPLIAGLGFHVAASLYCVFGIALTVLITARWRECMWLLDAPANRR
jgi:MFS family permease